MSEIEPEYTRDKLQEMLKTSTRTVTFSKVDGTERVMNCTLQSHLLPPVIVDLTKPVKERKINEEVLPVFDVDKHEWRSFRLDSIISVV
jgi:hypothetical protein